MKFILACALTNLFKIVINYLFISFLDSKINFFITLSYVYSLIEIIYFKPYPQFYFIKPIFWIDLIISYAIIINYIFEQFIVFLFITKPSFKVPCLKKFHININKLILSLVSDN